MGTLTEETLLEGDHGGLPPIDEGPPDFWDGRGGGDDDEDGPQRSVSVAGLVVGMVASAITFLVLGATLILRRNLSDDWVPLGVPGILWANTLVLLASSAALELARRAMAVRDWRRFTRSWWLGTALGCLFLAGQTVAWIQLARSGVYMTTNPSHGFFYILTWTHAAHAIGGLIALGWVGVAASRREMGARQRGWVTVASLFWHFLDVLWLGLMGLFFIWG